MLHSYYKYNSSVQEDKVGIKGGRGMEDIKKILWGKIYCMLLIVKYTLAEEKIRELLERHGNSKQLKIKYREKKV